MAIFAVGEAWAAKDPNVRAVMAEFDGWLKAGVSLVVSLALIDRDTAETIHHIRRDGVGLESAWAIVCTRTSRRPG